VKPVSKGREPRVEVQVTWEFAVPDALQRAAWEKLWHRLLGGLQEELDERCAPGDNRFGGYDGPQPCRGTAALSETAGDMAC
jgi:hypothetical protein